MGSAAAFLLPWLWPVYPAPGVFRSKERSRAYHCERVQLEAPSHRTTQRVEPPPPRGDYRQADLIVCTQPVLPERLRDPRDEVLLGTLDSHTQALTAAAQAVHPDLQQRTWLVEAHDPSSMVSAKIRFATQNALMEKGLAVSDRTPLLGFSDMQVITRLPPAEAHPAACSRYAQTGALNEDDVLLVIVRPDAQATSLVGGVCTQGRWSWL